MTCGTHGGGPPCKKYKTYKYNAGITNENKLRINI